MRLGFSVAMHIQPDVLLLDEVLAVGDEAFQQKCFGKIGDFKRGGGTIVFVSHDPGAVERLCDQAVLLDHGRSVERGPAGDVVRAYHRRLVSVLAGERRRPRGPSRRAGAGCTRCARSPATAACATASPRASRWRSRSGSTPRTGSTTRRVTLGLRDSDGRPLGSQTRRRGPPATRAARAAAAPLPGAADARGPLLRRRRPGDGRRRRRSSTTPSARSSSASSASDPGGGGRDSPRRHVGVTRRRRNRRWVT